MDAANACVFVTAESVGMTGTETPDAIQNNAALMHKLMTVRAHGSVAMGIAATVEEAEEEAEAAQIREEEGEEAEARREEESEEEEAQTEEEEEEEEAEQGQVVE